MTSKYIVEDFLQFLALNKGTVVTDNGSYSFKQLREALIEYHYLSEE